MMKAQYDAKDLRTLRLLHEYGFTDGELAEHLALPPTIVRRMRLKLALAPNGQGRSIAADRRRAHATSRHHPAQRHLGGQRGHPGAVLIKFVDDRHFVSA